MPANQRLDLWDTNTGEVGRRVHNVSLTVERSIPMFQLIHTHVRAWRRYRRAKQIHAALVQAGYTADDLIQIAQLRATVALEPDAETPPSDPTHPALGDVLAVWQP